MYAAALADSSGGLVSVVVSVEVPEGAVGDTWVSRSTASNWCRVSGHPNCLGLTLGMTQKRGGRSRKSPVI